MDVTQSQDSNGANVGIHKNNNQNNQQFAILASGTVDGKLVYRIAPKISQTRVLDVCGPSMSNDANIQLWTYGSANNQQKWIFEEVDTGDLYLPGWKGYAVYRDGVPHVPIVDTEINITWHAGLMDEEFLPGIAPVIQMNGTDEGVTWDDWDTFLNKPTNKYMGIYRPKQTLTDKQRVDICHVAEQLVQRGPSIKYSLLSQLQESDTFKKTGKDGQQIHPKDIGSIRCDGVVEYCYEYSGVRIYGNDEHWNISIYGNLAHHSGVNITPKSQAEQYMVKLTNQLPTT